VYVVHGVHGDYVVYQVGGVYKCTCMAGSFDRSCKHISQLLDEIGRGVRMPQPISSAKPKTAYHSSLPELDEVFGASYNSDVIVSIHGKPGVGKSLFALWECGNVVKQGGCFLYVDTEGGFKSMAEKWWPVLSKSLGVKDGGFVETCKTLERLHEFLGYRTEIVWVKDKLEFRIRESLEKPEIDEFIKANNVTFVVVDSVSMPVATAINEEQQNRPARFTATALIMGKLAELQERYGVCVLTIHHSSWNPANPYETFAQMRGGKIVHHFSKHVLYMDMRGKNELRNFRRLWIGRAEDTGKWGDVVFFSISDKGIMPVGREVGYEAGLLTDNELEYVRDNERWRRVLSEKRQRRGA